MLKDRFSVTSTPSTSPPPHNRTYSPAPRTSSRLAAPPQRPGISRQSSILSLASGSTASLPSTARFTNESSLKRSTEPPTNVLDPLKVLRSILGQPKVVKDGEAVDQGEAESLASAMDLDIDFGELSLQEFADLHGMRKPRPQGASSAIQRAQLYTEEREKYEDLHKSILDCDDVLQSVESYLTNFQAELGAVSAEIESLQSRSVQLNAKLENRKKVESLLGPAVEDISISPVMVRTIAEGPVDDNWVKALREVEVRANTVAKKSSRGQAVKPLEDLRPLLNDLKAKAVERIRDFIVSQIKALRSPNINGQVIQQGTLVKHKELYAFLSRNHKALADEIGQAYVNTMRWYYTNHFTLYHQALQKLQLHILDQQDMLGADPATQKRTALSSTKPQIPTHDPFNIGRRADILNSNNSAALPSHIAEESKSLHYLETPFHAYNLALIDNVSFEYSIVTELFTGTKSFQEITRLVDIMFAPAFQLGFSLTKSLIESSPDALGVLLCVRLNQRSAFALQRRKIPVAESYVNGTNMLLWPRFQQILDLHADSLKRAAASAPRVTTANAALSLVGGADPAKASVAPHVVTQRFGQFFHSVLVLSVDAGDDEPVANRLSRLRGDYEALMAKLSKNAGDVKRRERFLFNNYSLVSAIIGDCEGRVAEEQKGHFEELLRESKERK